MLSKFYQGGKIRIAQVSSDFFYFTWLAQHHCRYLAVVALAPFCSGISVFAFPWLQVLSQEFTISLAIDITDHFIVFFSSID
jgi:hypothetical protein